MTTSYMLDTNLLVYMHDGADPTKQRRAIDVVAHLGGGDRASIPAQALAEFASVALRKLTPELDAARVYRIMEEMGEAFPILPLTAEVVLEAVRGVRDFRMSYYDAQIWAVAKLAQVPVVLSEDFASGSVIEGVAFVNPFTPALSVSSL